MTKYPNTQIPKEARSPKSERASLSAVDFREDEVKLFRFLPKGFCFFTKIGACLHDHSEKELHFSRFLFAVSDLLFELLLRYRVIGLAVVSANARCSSDQLFDQTFSHRIDRHPASKRNHSLSEQGSSFLQIKRTIPRPRHRQDAVSSFDICHSDFLGYLGPWVSRHSSFFSS